MYHGIVFAVLVCLPPNNSRSSGPGVAESRLSSPSPPTTAVSAFVFCRGKTSALSSLADSCRINSGYRSVYHTRYTPKCSRVFVARVPTNSRVTRALPVSTVEAPGTENVHPLNHAPCGVHRTKTAGNPTAHEHAFFDTPGGLSWEPKPENRTGFVERSRNKFVPDPTDRILSMDKKQKSPKYFCICCISIRNGLVRRNQTPVLYRPRAGQNWF